MPSPLPDDAALARYRATLLGRQGLTPEDLVALRAGRMCPAALRVIRRAMGTERVLLVVGPIVGALGVALSVVIARVAPEQAFVIAGLSVAWPAIFVVAALLVMILGVAGAQALRRERTGPVLVLEGPAHPGEKHRGRKFVDVGNTQLLVQKEPVLDDVFADLVASWPVRVFVTARRRLVVGIEPLPAPPTVASRLD